MVKRKIRYVYKKTNEDLVVRTKENYSPSTGYLARKDDPKRRWAYKEYFKNVRFCCYSLSNCCEQREYRDSSKFIEYDRVTREFSLGSDGTFFYGISCCPFCGTRLPRGLGLEWIQFVEKELGQEYLSEPLINLLPEEFKTDEWWIKRGL